MTHYPGPLEFLHKAQTSGIKVFKSLKHPLNLNIVGWRSKASRPNYFDDYLALYWRTGNSWESRGWPITTLPGVPYLRNPLVPKGTAILVPGQYLGAYSLGEFKGYTCLKQVGLVRVFRDNNKDGAFDLKRRTMKQETIEEGLFGIHVHRAGWFSNFVGLASAGCQVFQKRDDFSDFIKLLTQSALMWGPNFTYTLMEI